MKFLYKFKLFDRRKAKRYEVFPPLKCICSCKELNQEGVLSYILVVSKIGLVFTTNDFQFSRASYVQLQFQLPNNPEIFSIGGVIVRTELADMKGKFKHAVKLASDLETKRAIDKLLNFCCKKKQP